MTGWSTKAIWGNNAHTVQLHICCKLSLKHVKRLKKKKRQKNWGRGRASINYIRVYSNYLGLEVYWSAFVALTIQWFNKPTSCGCDHGFWDCRDMTGESFFWNFTVDCVNMVWPLLTPSKTNSWREGQKEGGGNITLGYFNNSEILLISANWMRWRSKRSWMFGILLWMQSDSTNKMILNVSISILFFLPICLEVWKPIGTIFPFSLREQASDA